MKDKITIAFKKKLHLLLSFFDKTASSFNLFVFCKLVWDVTAFRFFPFGEEEVFGKLRISLVACSS